MRARLPSTAFALLAFPLAALAMFSACGGSDEPTDGGSDATTDVTQDIAKIESGPDVLDAGCQNDVDLTQYLPSADASIDVDAGGFDIAACTGCLKSSCGTDINACNNDCDCRQGVVDAVTCVANGGAAQTCFLGALSSNNADLVNLVSCAAGSCQGACLGSGGDAGKSDASADAADGD